jgi:hypothetical protein
LEATRIECLHSIIKDTSWIQAIHKDSMNCGSLYPLGKYNPYMSKSLELKIHQPKYIFKINKLVNSCLPKVPRYWMMFFDFFKVIGISISI